MSQFAFHKYTILIINQRKIRQIKKRDQIEKSFVDYHFRWFQRSFKTVQILIFVVDLEARMTLYKDESQKVGKELMILGMKMNFSQGKI